MGNEISYGQDFSATTGLDVTFRLVTGEELMGQVALRRLYCAKGQLVGCPDEELVDVRDLLGLGMTRAAIARAESLCEAALLGDQRISYARVTITPISSEELRIRAVGEGSLGPFSLLLSVTAVSVSVLSGES